MVGFVTLDAGGGGSGSVDPEDVEAIIDALKGQPDGLASLDGTGKLPASQLPITTMEWKGNWSPETNSPTLAGGVGGQGDVWTAITDGTVDFGSGAIEFLTGDEVVYTSDGVWKRMPGAARVTSVNGQIGDVVLD